MENEINSFVALYEAYRKVRLGKRNNPTAMKFRINAVSRVAALSERLQSGDWDIGEYVTFKVYEPKERDVMDIGFESKVVLHSLCDNVLYPAVSRRLIRDNYASQVGKGTHDGLDRLTKAMRHYFFSRKQRDCEERRARGDPYRPMDEWDYADGWVLKGDFAKYFYTLRHDICKSACRKALKSVEDEELRNFADWLMDVIIESTEDPGVPIGNQTSQLIALVYLDWMDHFIKDDLGLIYGRYMDDFYIIHESREYLKGLLRVLERRCADVGLSLNNETQIFPLKNGIDFLGCHTYLTKTGKVVRKIRQKSKNNMRRKIRAYRKLVDEGRMTIEKVEQSYGSWRAHAEHANTYHLLKNMDEYYRKYFPEEKEDENAATSVTAATRQQDQARKNLRRRHHLEDNRQGS